MKILITGASRGIGKAMADHLHALGNRVIGCARTPPKNGAQWRHIPADLCAEADVHRLFSTLRHEEGSIDALINNAGTARMAPFLLTPEEETRRLFELNFFSVIRCIRESVKLLRKSEHQAPSIINMTSVASLMSLEGHMPYAASKAAVEQSTRILAREFAPMNIRVNAIGLPPVRTAMTRTLPKQVVGDLVARQALQRMCEMDDIAGPVEFFLSPRSRFVTGETLYLGGVK